MSTKELLRFRDMLIAGRGEILERVHKLHAALRSLSEPEIELEEEAQKASITDALDRLGANGKVKIELIDLALRKMSVGDYGICESCGDDIALRRLEALPWTRLCVDCAREYERKRKELPRPSDVVISTEAPEEYQALSDEQLLKAVFEHLEKHLDVDSLTVRVTARKGAIYLEGTTASELDHQLILQVLTVDMGLSAVVDLLEVDEPIWQGDGDGSDSGPYLAA